MENNKDQIRYKKTKWFASIIKEKLWLEEMAQKGYILCDISGGIRYTFEIAEPKHLIYEIDRFNIPKNPTLKEIHHKQEFFELATEMGWREVTHDEDMNYYFTKEYVEGESNELYSDVEMRKIRANKYRERYEPQIDDINMYSVLFLVSMLVFAMITKLFSFYILFFPIVTLGLGIFMKKIADATYNELCLTTEEWKANYIENGSAKVTWKWIYSEKGLIKYLSKQSAKGWHLVEMTPCRYNFKMGEAQKRIYLVDTKKIINKRTSDKNEKVVRDTKDLLMQSNDWQVQSVKEANESGWDFVCAFKNQLILYVNNENGYTTPIPLKLKNNSIHPWLSAYGYCFLVGAAIGVICVVIGL